MGKQYYNEQEYEEFAIYPKADQRQRISCREFFSQINPPRSPEPITHEENTAPCKASYERVPTEFLTALLKTVEKNAKTEPMDFRRILELVNATYERTSEQEHKHVLELAHNRNQLKKEQNKQRTELRERLLKQEHELEMKRIKGENETQIRIREMKLQEEELRLSVEKAREKTKASALKQTRWFVILFLGILLFILFYFQGFALSYNEYQLGPSQQNPNKLPK